MLSNATFHKTFTKFSTIYGYDGSTAHVYAITYDKAFDDIANAPVVTTVAMTTTAETTSTTITTQTGVSGTDTTTDTGVSGTGTTTDTSVSGTDTTTETTTTEPSDIVPGDANGDGEVSVRDASLIARMLAEKRISELPLSADFNGDGEVSVRDAAAIAAALAKGKL